MTTSGEYHFDDSYYEEATLRDGTVVHLRLIGPDDKELLCDGFQRLSPESRYRRFFTPKPRLSRRELAYLTETDNINHLAIGAARFVNSDEEGLGVARLVRLEGADDTAEAAIAVVDDFQGKGLGSLLFQRLVAAARERGLTRLRSEVLGSNRGMLELLRSMSDHVHSSVRDGVVTVDLELPVLEPEHPVSQPPRQSGPYRVLTMAAEGSLQLRRLFPWLRRALAEIEAEIEADADGEADADADGDGDGEA
jgi:GNAT superfamily N-acetyltransferase